MLISYISFERTLTWAALLLEFPYLNLFMWSLAICSIFLLQIKYFPLKFLIMDLLFTMSFFFGCSSYENLPFVQPYFPWGSLRRSLLSFRTTYCHLLSSILKWDFNSHLLLLIFKIVLEVISICINILIITITYKDSLKTISFL